MTATTNWKNVNNWHWVEKNCIPWAKDYFTEKMVGISASKDDTTIQVKDLSEFGGDCDLNQRKGKLMAIFDLNIKLRWEGTDPNGNSAKGTIHLPEFMYDTDVDDLVTDVVAESENQISEKCRSIIKSLIVPQLKTILSGFTKNLMENHQEDVYIAPENMSGHPAHVPYKPRPPVVATTVNPTQTVKSVQGGVTSVKQTVEFVCSAQDLYETLMDQQRAMIWSKGSANISKQPGTEYSFFGGHVSGVLLETKANKNIVQKWRLKTWPKDHFSQVTIELEQSEGSVALHLHQTGVPIGEREVVEANWHQYFWNPIKGAFGYGAML